MNRLQKGLASGLAATLVISGLELIKGATGVLPYIEFPRLLAAMLGAPGNELLGWAAHFAAGTLVLGPLFAMLCPRLPTDTPESKGVLFAVCAWVVMMLTIAPLSGVGFFGVISGFWSPVWTLALHIVFGASMGFVWSRLNERERRAGRMPHPATA